MSVSSEYVEYISDLLSEFTDLTTKNFFGGKAFCSSQLGKETQFAMVINDVLYFVVDDITRPKYEAIGMQAFSYDKKTGTVMVKKYYTVPEELFEDAEKMTQWALEALETAVRS
ncbi:MAG: TfoX domain containing protein [Sulfurovum sp.]|nr:MAG: TfoX domain containing protein [Sulfurovum sp.]